VHLALHEGTSKVLLRSERVVRGTAQREIAHRRLTAERPRLFVVVLEARCFAAALTALVDEGAAL
jgi:hypothetical protein